MSDNTDTLYLFKTNGIYIMTFTYPGDDVELSLKYSGKNLKLLEQKLIKLIRQYNSHKSTLHINSFEAEFMKNIVTLLCSHK
jgi:hypothetical protein